MGPAGRPYLTQTPLQRQQMRQLKVNSFQHDQKLLLWKTEGELGLSWYAWKKGAFDLS